MRIELRQTSLIFFSQLIFSPHNVLHTCFYQHYFSHISYFSHFIFFFIFFLNSFATHFYLTFTFFFVLFFHVVSYPSYFSVNCILLCLLKLLPKLEGESVLIGENCRKFWKRIKIFTKDKDCLKTIKKFKFRLEGKKIIFS